jgi:four helix bundle protein
MTNDQGPKSQANPNDQSPMTKKEDGIHENDLQERTACFGEAVIRFVRPMPLNAITSAVINQLVRSDTSVGANYCEADDAESKKDFRHKISICLKEAKETRHWLRMMAAAVPESRDEARTLYKEAKELNLIFAAIKRKCLERPSSA